MATSITKIRARPIQALHLHAATLPVIILVQPLTRSRGQMSFAFADRKVEHPLHEESSMLPLDDDRWGHLTTFYGKPEDLPKVLEEWLASIGFDQEDTIYHRDLFDLFLHQATITNAAFAVVPYLVDVCKRGETRFQVEYLTDVALVEARRLQNGVKGNREGTEENPEWLMADYKQAILESRNLADDVIEAEHDEERKRVLVKMKPALHGNAALAWSQW